ncbi:MobF family relaxase [Fimbriiglobus ruber]|uniref:IncW plasmid conjugative relaxase protein TrwC (TraI) n=1 Tax=Fimbriiglobus ruber TaxID=1908690 RepID=A0A225DP42_9BACT|nr:MobF family relaxase [Fimbriiglobus ruber]OWK38935.1 IncW plasmid conjugative relaxase protein TrwC (TraI) [Fimbriiglobus ruber]OWK38969.1 IncW plasmid conjugative relaxase protein TrwC (TraI) [Fimbriiglobus ruber]
MLRIHQSASAAQAKQYYTQALDRTDYYARDGEQPGIWFGQGAERLGLAGEVSKEAFFALLENRQPGTQQRLTARDKGDQRRPGWDLVFSPPKSVSVLQALTGDERIREAMLTSAKETLAEIEAEAIATRLRRGGQQGIEPVSNLVASLFTHDTTRALGDNTPDPHDHIHAYVHNAAWIEREHRWQAIDTHALHIDRPYYEAAFEARLAARLAHDLGYHIERRSNGWEIAGVPQTVIDKMSRRTAEIEAEAKRRGITSAADKGQLGAKTRRAKGDPIPSGELRDNWLAKLTPDERQAIATTFNHARGPGGPQLGTTPLQALAHAADHHFERESTVPVKTLLTSALKFGVGAVTPESLREQFPRQGLLTAKADGRLRATAADVLAEEQAMLRFTRDGRGACDPLGGYGEPTFRRDDLNSGQKRAVTALLSSFDRVQILRGLAGVGKSTALGELRNAIEAQGRSVFAVAPSTGARDILRADGFHAETIAMLLTSEAQQKQLASGVLIVDEAGMVGSRDMARLFALAERQGARVILSGDSAQHRSPARGTALRLLEERGGLKPAGLTEILRQTGKLRDAVAALAGGHGEEGFDRLDAMGAINETPDAAQRYQLLARDYVDTLQQSKEALAIAPTHAEGEAVGTAIRTELKSRGLLGSNEHCLLRLENTNLTTAQRQDAAQYRDGDVVQFVQNVKGGWRKGDRATVVSHGESGVQVRTVSGEVKALPLAAAEKFQLYRTQELTVAAGDRIRFTLGGTTRDHKRLSNGRVATIAGFTPGGDVRLDNGWVVPKEFGHVASGWTVTSHASQGRTVKGRVFLAQSAASLPASNLSQFYVSVSRAKGGPGAVAIYTDDKFALRRAVARSDQPITATELLNPRAATTPAWASMLERVRRLAYHAKVYARLGLDHVREQLTAAQSHVVPREVSYER